MKKLITVAIMVIMALACIEAKCHITATNHDEEPGWEFYFTYFDDKPASVYLNLGLHPVAPIKEKPELVRVSLKMNHPQENGMSSNAENQTLFDIEDAIVKKLSSEHNSTYVGRITSDGYREFYFYLPAGEAYEESVSAAMRSFPTYSGETFFTKDEKWDFYFSFLYPTEEDFQSIQNRKVIEMLIDHGDKLTKERDVFHWIYFKNETDRKAYLAKIEKHNFTTVSTDYEKSRGEYPYGLRIKRKDRVDPASVDDYAIYLWQTANETDAKYDGWETTVVKF